jgi:hypothetical protein
MRKFELPDEAGAFDRWELKMEKKSAALLKEWSDLMLFANYETIVVDIDGKKKGKGGKRTMSAAHHVCWDAKNRFGLPEKMLFEFREIEKIFGTPVQPVQRPVELVNKDMQPSETWTKTVEALPAVQAPPPDGSRPDGIPDQLWNLMTMSCITEADIRKAVASRGYYPEDTPIAKYDAAFIQGKLVAGFDKLEQLINKLKGN